jgi:RecJ-like exonuclease
MKTFKCPVCDGKGRIADAQVADGVVTLTWSEGQIKTLDCSVCAGKGTVER